MAGIVFEVESDMATLPIEIRKLGKKTLKNLAPELRLGHAAFLRENLDRPVKFTENSLFAVNSNSATPEILVGIKDTQAAYLEYAYEGGHREKAFVPTASAPTDGHGNVPLGYSKAITAADGFWLTTRSGLRGLFAPDQNGGLDAKAFYMPADYEKLIDFDDEMVGLVEELLPEAAAKAFEKVFKE